MPGLGQPGDSLKVSLSYYGTAAHFWARKERMIRSVWEVFSKTTLKEQFFILVLGQERRENKVCFGSILKNSFKKQL